MIENGCPASPGATLSADGTNFSVYSGSAEGIDVCLFDERGNETSRHELPNCTDGMWHGFLPGIGAGQQYGYRAHGRYAPLAGQRHNPAKLLLDPYTRQLAGTFTWSPAVFDYRKEQTKWQANDDDSAFVVPRSVVPHHSPAAHERPSMVPWEESIFYELNVRGYTMRMDGLSDAERGKFRGLTNGKVLKYLTALGITSIELMPVFEFIDEEFLPQKGLSNFWGYNSISFFTPAMRYASHDPVSEFREMTNALHDAGFEIILDVAYNHTGESDTRGPTLSFRGLDNLGYYRTLPDDPGQYINDTGTGNTINVDHPQVRRLIIESLRYWATDMGADGFRFDLATILGRDAQGFATDHPLLEEIAADPLLCQRKFIAEPWDPGPGGYQLGGFPAHWSEWNDRFRDSVRRFWRGDACEAAEFVRRLHGSADIFEATGRAPRASINLVTAHDGFTLADVVSYSDRHNEANGEGNRDGHEHNFSTNHGHEGPSADAGIIAARRRQRLNMLASLLLSQGVPMLLAGDEFGNSQYGNNNAYAQDNEIGWLDWSGLEDDPEFHQAVQALIFLRRDTGLLRQAGYLHGHTSNAAGWTDISWLRCAGPAMRDEDWASGEPFTIILAATESVADESVRGIAIALNPGNGEVDHELPQPFDALRWQLVFHTAPNSRLAGANRIHLGNNSLAIAVLRN